MFYDWDWILFVKMGMLSAGLIGGSSFLSLLYFEE